MFVYVVVAHGSPLKNPRVLGSLIVDLACPRAHPGGSPADTAVLYHQVSEPAQPVENSKANN
jgi:hypothetical protein